MQPSTSQLSSEDQPSSEDLKPLRKMRRLSGFNTWHAEYLRSTGLYYYGIMYLEYSMCELRCMYLRAENIDKGKH